MQVESIRLESFKGIAVTLRWSSVTGLFGPNDSGKTSVLEAAQAAFTDLTPARFDPHERLT